MRPYKKIAGWRKKTKKDRRLALVEYDIDCLFREIDGVKKFLRKRSAKTTKK